MKQTKKLLSLVLLLAMLLSLAPAAYAADAGVLPEDEGYGSSWETWDEEPAVEPEPAPVEEPAPAVEPEPVVEPTPAEEEVLFPANQFFYVGGSGLRVNVEAPEGAFPADTDMTVT